MCANTILSGHNYLIYTVESMRGKESDSETSKRSRVGL